MGSSIVVRLRVKDFMWSRKIKHFSFSVFHYKSESYKKRRNYIVTTKNICIRIRNRFVLGNKETIINEGNDQNGYF